MNKRRFRLTIGGRSIRRDVDHEIQFYLDMRAQELIDGGMNQAEARLAAQWAFGDRKSVAAQCRQLRREHLRRRHLSDVLQGIGQDARFAFRSLRRSPGFTLTIIITLALGIGANTAIFSLLNGVLIQPLPYASGADLVRLHQPAEGAGGANLNFSPLEVADYAAQSQTLTGLVEYHSMPFILLGLEDPRRVQTGVVSSGFFDLLGVEPIMGRTFLPGEDQHGADPVLVLSYHAWRDVFGADEDVVGREVEMNDRIHTIVGVIPEIPHHPDRNDVYMPVASCPFRSGPGWSENRTARGISVFGRMGQGRNLEQVRADLETVAGRLHESHPDAYPSDQGYHTTAVPLRDELVNRARPSLFILVGAAAFLLLIVSANVANLTLARLNQRERELTVRAALGAGRGRLFRQLLTESTLLALVGGGVGLVLAYAGLDVLVAFVSRLTARAAEVRIDGTVLAFTLLVSLGTGLVVSLLPALPVRASLADELKEGGANATGGRARLRARGLLIMSQVAVSFVLLVGAGLMLRTFVNLLRVDSGFDGAQVLTARLDLDWNRYTTGEKRRAFAAELSEQLLAKPGVLSVAFASTVPLNGQSPQRMAFKVKGALAEEMESPQVEGRVVTADYFRVLQVPTIRGRTFERSDGPESRVVVVNATMARQYLGGVDEAVGRYVQLGSGDWDAVVGVVGDVRHDGLGQTVDPAVYLSQARSGRRDMRVLIRSQLDEANAAMLLRRLVRDIDPSQPVTDIRTLAQVRHESLAQPRVTALLVGGFALLALVITAAGIAGIIAYSVSQRTREIGIRMALGADRQSVIAMVLRQGLHMVVAGLAVGFVGAVALTRLLDGMLAGSGLLFGIGPTDMFTFALGTIVLLGVAFGACFAPARRATSIDPMHALRSE